MLAATGLAAALLVVGTGCSTPTAGPTSPASVAASEHSASPSTRARAAKAAIAAPRVARTTVPSTQGTAVAGAGALRQVHSPGAVELDEQLSPGQCQATSIDAATGEYLPDPSCTPGAVDPAVTQSNIDTTICRSGYTATVRPPASETDRFKVTSLAAYGETENPTIELDHLVSLEIGGANSASNLWPELNRAGATGTTNPKDAVEDTLHTAVCNHQVTLAAAQNAIASDWITALANLGL